MISDSTSYIGPEADVKYRLTTSAFGDGVLDAQQKSIISSLVGGEVAHLTQSARLTISRTYVSLITATLMAEWRIRPGSSLEVSRSSIVSLDDLSTQVPTSI